MSKYRRNNIKPSRQGGTDKCKNVGAVISAKEILVAVPEVSSPVVKASPRQRNVRVGKRPTSMGAIAWQ